MSFRAGDWPLVGRSDELRYLREALVQPGAGGVVLVGRPGVGKTRLAREVMAAATGYVDEWILATRAAGGIPLAPFAHLLPDGRDIEQRHRLALFRALEVALAERAAGRPLLVGVDDAHLLDPASAALVLHLAVTGAAKVVATARAGESMPDAIVALWKDDVTLRLDLQALSEAETAAMVTAGLGGHLERATSAWLYEATEGNPLFVRELVAGALEAGTLCRGVGGAWRWSGEMAPTPRLVDTIEARLGSVDSAGRRVLELLALGEPLGLEVLEAMVSPDSIGEMEAAGYVVVDSDAKQSHARLGHPLYGQVLRAAMPRTRTRSWYRLLADTVEAAGDRGGDDALRQVVWRLESGSHAAPEHLTEAARRANLRFDHRLAQRLAMKALDAGAGVAAAVVLAEADNEQNRFAEADAALAPWEATGALGADQRLAERYLLQRVQALHWGMGRTDEAKQYLDRADSARHERWWRDLVRALHAQVLAAEGGLHEAFALARPLVHDPGVDDCALVRAVSTVSTIHSLSGRTDSALAVLGRATDAARRLADELPRAPTWVMAQQVMALLFAGRLTELEDVVTPVHARAVSHRDHHLRAVAAMVLGRIALIRGSVTTACAWLDEAADPYRTSDPSGHLPLCLASLSQARSQAGDLPGAGVAREEAVARARPGTRWHEGDLAVAEVWITAASGQVARAAELAGQRGAALARMPMFEAVLRHQAVRLGVSSVDGAKRLTALAREAESPWLETLAAHARVLTAGDGRGLEEVARRFERFGALLPAAEALAQAAVAHTRSGEAGAGRRCGAESRRLATACEGARTPALSAAEFLPLTQREREVSVLASQGLPNEAIAERLVLSVRTVESHLYSAYAKLGVHRREDLKGLVD